MHLAILPCLYSFALLGTTLTLALHQPQPQVHPKPIIIDTDIYSDVDDLGALAIANVLSNFGLAELKGVVISTGSEYGALTVDVSLPRSSVRLACKVEWDETDMTVKAVNTYYGNGHVKIGAIRPLTQETFVDRWGWQLGEYASKVAHHFPRALRNATQTPSPVTLYRKILADAAVNSLTVISIGFLTNLADLLESGMDEISPATGVDLISYKVAELVIMGGNYPSGWEYNFAGVDPKVAHRVISGWPKNVPITYSGYELGSHIWTGQHLAQEAPADLPVLAAYQWYGDRCNTTLKSYDPVTVLYGFLGLGGRAELGIAPMFEYANADGYNSVNTVDGINTWVEDASVRNQHWLRLRPDVTVPDIEEVLNRLLVQSPRAADGRQGEIIEDLLRSQLRI
nr:hypothetical protein B0A51_13780 [Rachicladosporium sp. CCFEE 5018]